MQAQRRRVETVRQQPDILLQTGWDVTRISAGAAIPAIQIADQPMLSHPKTSVRVSNDSVPDVTTVVVRHAVIKFAF